LDRNKNGNVIAALTGSIALIFTGPAILEALKSIHHSANAVCRYAIFILIPPKEYFIRRASGFNAAWIIF
jgi:hypothetical protein